MVLQYVEDVILQQKTVILIKKLYEIYKSHSDDTRYHHKLKFPVKEKLSEKMLFFQPNNGYLDVIIASDSLEY